MSAPSTVLQPSRRALALGAATLLVTGLGLGQALAQARKGPAEVPLAELMKTDLLPDIVLGKADAPVTIVEYASMTCGHCANFHNNVLPTLKQKYIDTGKVRMILREFPLDNLAAAGSMLARCSGDKAPEVIATLFKTQDNWAFVKGNPVPALFKVAEGLGFTKDSFDKCLTESKQLEAITAIRDRASKSFGVNSTPTFFINGKRFDGHSDQVEAFDKVLEPLLATPAPASAPAPGPAATPPAAPKK